jgi:methylenetetrahydrofolate--tRNA-(uracil-5-)-methyltransferase
MKKVDFTANTMLGAFQNHISTIPNKNYLPMNANYGILSPLGQYIRNKSKKYAEYAKKSFQTITQIISLYDI